MYACAATFRWPKDEDLHKLRAIRSVPRFLGLASTSNTLSKAFPSRSYILLSESARQHGVNVFFSHFFALGKRLASSPPILVVLFGIVDVVENVFFFFQCLMYFPCRERERRLCRVVIVLNDGNCQLINPLVVC